MLLNCEGIYSLLRLYVEKKGEMGLSREKNLCHAVSLVNVKM